MPYDEFVPNLILDKQCQSSDRIKIIKVHVAFNLKRVAINMVMPKNMCSIGIKWVDSLRKALWVSVSHFAPPPCLYPLGTCKKLKSKEHCLLPSIQSTQAHIY